MKLSTVLAARSSYWAKKIPFQTFLVNFESRLFHKHTALLFLSRVKCKHTPLLFLSRVRCKFNFILNNTCLTPVWKMAMENLVSVPTT